MMSEQNPSPKKSNTNNFLQLSGAGLQMGVTIYIGAKIGQWLDGKYPSDKNWFTLIFTTLFFGVALYNLLQQLKKINRD